MTQECIPIAAVEAFGKDLPMLQARELGGGRIVIAFSGHRDRVTLLHHLDTIIEEFGSDALWVHGGADGFDSQVESFARKNLIETKIILPDYEKYGSPTAQFVRNHEIVNMAQMLVACYDGRKTGGTRHAIIVAKKLGMPVILVDPCDIVANKWIVQ